MLECTCNRFLGQNNDCFSNLRITPHNCECELNQFRKDNESMKLFNSQFHLLSFTTLIEESDNLLVIYVFSWHNSLVKWNFIA